MFSLLFATAFIFYLGISVFIGNLPQIIFWIYLLLSSACIIAYARDKSAAKNKQRRIPEKTLHLWAVSGGWPGAAIAQVLFHHKSQKRSFQVIFWVSIMVNCILLSGFILLDSLY